MGVEPGSRSELDRCLLLQVPAAGCPDSVFVVLFRTAIERASCGGHCDNLLRTGGVPTSLVFTVMSAADGRFGLYRSERRDELFSLVSRP